jgi:hypothetical protein
MTTTHTRHQTTIVLTLAALLMVLSLPAHVQAVAVITDLNTGLDWTVLNDEGMDDADGNVVRTGDWERQVLGGNAFNGIGYRAFGTPTATNTWTYLGLPEGLYEVAASWQTRGNEATNAPFSINGNTPLLIDQRSNPTGPPNLLDQGGAGNPAINEIGYQLLSSNATVDGTGTLTVLLTTNDADGFVLADSIAIRQLPAAIPEPSALALSALAILSLGFVGWRRRRR